MTQRSYFYRPWSELFNLLTEDFPSGVSSLSSAQVYNSKFPPCNISVEEKSLDLTLEFALAGYKLEDIEISFEDDYMLLKVEGKKEEKEEKKEYLYRGIKKSTSHSKYYVPFSKYNTDSVNATFENGVLKVLIPAKEERKPKKIIIQG